MLDNYDAVGATTAALDGRSSHQTDVIPAGATIGTPMAITQPDHSQPARNADEAG